MQLRLLFCLLLATLGWHLQQLLYPMRAGDRYWSRVGKDTLVLLDFTDHIDIKVDQASDGAGDFSRLKGVRLSHAPHTTYSACCCSSTPLPNNTPTLLGVRCPHVPCLQCTNCHAARRICWCHMAIMQLLRGNQPCLPCPGVPQTPLRSPTPGC